ncbi:hypothetical protein [Vitreimonas sp.]|uniref:hypothetical protein n=1 Tax=Vitreimonas sp. TaxID=3069702 RepID=UPI002ED803AB
MTTPEKDQDPYAPPPRHTDKSGAFVRVAILGALLAGATWGYLNFVSAPQTASLVPAAEEQTFAEARAPDSAPLGNGPTTREPAPAAPANSPPAAAPAAPLEPVPPPATAIEPDAPPPTIDGPSGD